MKDSLEHLTENKRDDLRRLTETIRSMAFATLLASAPRREGTSGKLRSDPIQKALAQQAAASSPSA